MDEKDQKIKDLEEKIEVISKLCDANVDKRFALEDCAILIQSILSNGGFVVETVNESALVKAMIIAGFPIKVAENLRDVNFDYANHKTFINEIIDHSDTLIKALKHYTRHMDRCSTKLDSLSECDCNAYTAIEALKPTPTPTCGVPIRTLT